jgi:thiol:disulfide interchange protein
VGHRLASDGAARTLRASHLARQESASHEQRHLHRGRLRPVGARLAYLALNVDLFLAAPASAIDLRDGGWHAATGIAAGAAWLAWTGWRVPTLRRPLQIAALAGLSVWTTASMVLSPRNTAPVPALVVSPLDGGPSTELRLAAAGRPVVVNLWASWCGPCRQEMPTLAQVQSGNQHVDAPRLL